MSNKRFIINILIVAVVIALLVGALYYLSRPAEDNGPGDTVVDEQRITVFSVSPADMLSADVTNKYGSYALYRAGGGWNLAGFEGMHLDVNMLDALTNSFSKVTSSQLIDENPGNPGDYGLSAPTATLALGTSGGGRTFYIGNETPDGRGYYFSTDESSAVYLMDSYVADVVFLTARD